jgi:hypothetical protein
LAAANAIERQRPDAEIQQLLSEAVAFARINHNQVVEVKTAALRSRYLRASKRA